MDEKRSMKLFYEIEKFIIFVIVDILERKDLISSRSSRISWKLFLFLIENDPESFPINNGENLNFMIVKWLCVR